MEASPEEKEKGRRERASGGGLDENGGMERERAV